VLGLGFRVQGSGFVLGLGFRVQGSGFVLGLGFRVQGSGFVLLQERRDRLGPPCQVSFFGV
jgi:hypothetical protein